VAADITGNISPTTSVLSLLAGFIVQGERQRFLIISFSFLLFSSRIFHYRDIALSSNVPTQPGADYVSDSTG
jgi:hypothetical protein